MSLRDEQVFFVNNIMQLISHAQELEFEVTFGEAYRTPEQQEIYFRTGKTKTMDSYHLKRLAIDLNFFKDGKYLTAKEDLQELGDYWEGLSESNSWGGNWKSFVDTPHFQKGVISGT